MSVSEVRIRLAQNADSELIGRLGADAEYNAVSESGTVAVELAREWQPGSEIPAVGPDPCPVGLISQDPYITKGKGHLVFHE